MFVNASFRLFLISSAVYLFLPGEALSQSIAECPVSEVELLNRFSFDESSDGLVEEDVGGLSVTSTGISDVPGVVNGAGRFDAGSVLSLGAYDPDLSEGLTISGWVNPENFASVEARFISKADGISSSNHYLMAGTINGDALRFRLKTNGVTKTLISIPGVLTANAWSFVSFTYDKEAMRIYHNGELVAQQAVTGEISGSATVETSIGNQPVTGGRLYTGLLDDLRVYNGALSEAQLLELMEHRAGDCVDDGEPPEIPLDLRVSDTETSSESISLSWSAVSDVGDSGLGGYRLLRDGEQISEQSETGYVDTGLMPLGTYVYGLSAFDNAGNETAAVLVTGMTLPDTQAPSDPGNVRAESVTDESVRLTWSASVDEGGSTVAGYEVLRDGELLAELDETSTSYMDSELEVQSAYAYQVRAFDSSPARNVSESAVIEVSTLPESQGECLALDTPLVSHYALDGLFDGVLRDELGLRDGVRSSVGIDSGVIGNAGVFRTEALGSEVLGTVPGYDPQLFNGVSVSMWVRPEVSSSIESRFISKASGVQGSEHYLMVGSFQRDALRFRLKTNNTTTTLISDGGVLEFDQWQFVTFTYDLQRMRIYHDGELVAQVNKSGAISRNAALDLALGNQPQGAGDRQFVGLMDDVRIYDGALSEQEIAQLMAHRAGGCGPVDNEPPSIPSNVALQRASADEVVLSWNASIDSGSAGLRGYRIERNGESLGELLSLSDPLQFIDDQGLQPLSSYTYRISAVDNAGNESTATELVVLTSAEIDETAPASPTGLIVTLIEDTRVEFSWTPVIDEQGSGLQGYLISRDGGVAVMVGADVTPLLFVDTGLSADTSYTYTVIAVDNAGNVSAPAELSLRTFKELDVTAPAAPSDLEVVGFDSQTIQLAWTAVADDEGGSGLRGYELQIDGQASQFLEVDAISYEHAGLLPDTQHVYSLVAVDFSDNRSGPVSVSQRTLADESAPGVPGSLAGIALSSTEIELTWSASVDEGGSTVAGYEVLRDGELLAELDETSTSYMDSELEVQSAYAYQVRAFDSSPARNVSESAVIEVSTLPESQGECLALDTPLVSHYALDGLFDGVLRDELGLRDGVRSSVGIDSGVIGNAGVFRTEALGSEVLGTVPGYDPQLFNGVSVSMWVRPEVSSSIESRFISKASGVQGSEHYLMVGSFQRDALRFRLKTNNTTTTLISDGGVLEFDQWQFVTFTYDLQRMRIYHDGELVAQVNKSGAISRNAALDLALGNQPQGAGDRQFVGLMDDVRIYDGALSEQEIAQLMAHRAGGCGDVIVDQIAPPSPSSLQISEVSSNSVLLEWIAVEDEAGGSGLRSYILQRQGGELVEVLEGTSYLDTNLEPSTVYEYSIRAQDNARNLSEPSNISVETEVEQLPAVSLQIISPENPAVAIVDESIEFVAQISDVSFDEQVVWRSDLSGELGTGSSLQLALSAIGVHRITAEVVDSEGLIFTDQIVINVINTDVITPTEPIKLFDGDSLSPFYTWYQFTGFGPSENTIEVNSGEIKILPANNPETPTNRSEGSLITNNSFANYIAVLEFRWGDFQIFPNFVRDAGLIVHSTGNNGGWRGRYLPGIEVQQSEGSMGDIILLKDDAAPMSITANTAQLDCVFDSLFCRGGFIWDPDSPIRVFTDDVTAGPNYGNLHNRVWSAAWQNQTGFRGPVDYENQHGDWNQFVVIADGDLIDVYFNGQHVNSASNVFPSAGQLQLQLEWTEYYVRRFELLPLSSNVEPIISSYSMPAAVADSAYAFVLDAESMNPPVVYSVSEGSLPAGLALDAETGTISGVPFSIGEFSFEVAVTDSVGLSSEQSFTVVVE